MKFFKLSIQTIIILTEQFLLLYLLILIINLFNFHFLNNLNFKK